MAANQALQLDVEERKKIYTFRYRDLPNSTNKSDKTVVLPSNTKPSPPKPATITKRKNSSGHTDKKLAKKPKYTSVKPINNQASVSAVNSHSGPVATNDCPFAFSEPGLYIFVSMLQSINEKTSFDREDLLLDGMLCLSMSWCAVFIFNMKSYPLHVL